MSAAEVDANVSEIPARIAELGQRVLDGGQVTREEALELFALEDSADIHTLLSWGNRIREHFKGNKICLLYTSPSPRDRQKSRMPSSA